MSERKVSSLSGRTRAKTATIEFPIVSSASSVFPPGLPTGDFGRNFYSPQNVFRNIQITEHPNYSLHLRPGPGPLQRHHSGNPQKLFQSDPVQAQHPRPPRPINVKFRILNASKSARRASDTRTHEQNQTGFTVDQRSTNRLVSLSKPENRMLNTFTKTDATRVPAPAASIPLTVTSEIPTCRRSPEHESPDAPATNMHQVMSDTLHMDQAGLTQFPILGPNDRHIRLLSLQHNLISRLQNPIVLNNLIVLDLYSNKIERISGLQAFHNLRVLLLGKNRIRRMEGLDGLKRIEILDLHGNQLRYLDNLNGLGSLRILNVAGNVIRSIRNFGPSDLSSLTELNLKRNRLRSLNGLEKAKNLKKLFVSNNELQSIAALDPLRKLTFLDELLVESNPLCSIPEYKNSVLNILPTLTTFDRTVISERMRKDSRRWHELQNSEAPLETLQDNGGVPAKGLASREDAIILARKRWETVIDFVKTKSREPKPEFRFKDCEMVGSKSEPRDSTFVTDAVSTTIWKSPETTIRKLSEATIVEGSRTLHEKVRSQTPKILEVQLETMPKTLENVKLPTVA